MNYDLTVRQILEITSGFLFCGDENTVLKTYSKDTRVLNVGDVYIGIKGENFDGNTLYKDAFEKGASACILEKESFQKDEGYNYDKPIILVENSVIAIKQIAEYIRDNSKAIFIAVTGSVGKTSTRDMVYSVVSQKYKSLKTEGNYNNEIGTPLTMMRVKDHECAVIEMGMSSLGEIDYLTKIVRPHIALITNVGTAHIGLLGSRENILKAKLEIKNGLVEDGTLIINNDNDMLHGYYETTSDKVLTIGIENKSDIMAKDIELTNDNVSFNVVYKDNEYKVLCPVPSMSFVYNSLEAFAAGILANIEPDKIIKGIQSFEMTKDRLDTFDTENNVHIINDSYNASLDSMKSSLQILKNSQGKRKIAVLGDMFELGSFAKNIHTETGYAVKDNDIDILITVGENAKYIKAGALEKGMNETNIYSFDKNEDAINKLKEILKSDDTLLIKASNGMHFIEIVNALK